MNSHLARSTSYLVLLCFLATPAFARPSKGWTRLICTVALTGGILPPAYFQLQRERNIRGYAPDEDSACPWCEKCYDSGARGYLHRAFHPVITMIDIYPSDFESREELDRVHEYLWWVLRTQYPQGTTLPRPRHAYLSHSRQEQAAARRELSAVLVELTERLTREAERRPGPTDRNHWDVTVDHLLPRPGKDSAEWRRLEAAGEFRLLSLWRMNYISPLELFPAVLDYARVYRLDENGLSLRENNVD